MDLPGYANTVIGDLLSEAHHLDHRIQQYDAHIRAMAKQCTAAQRLMPWLGLVPGQYSSGGKTRLGRITKAGGAYIRSLLVLRARAMLNAARSKNDSISRWAVQLQERRGYWKAVVAIAAEERTHGLGSAHQG